MVRFTIKGFCRNYFPTNNVSGLVKKTRCGVDSPNLQNMKNKYLVYYGQIGQVKKDRTVPYVQIIWRTTLGQFQNIDEYLYVLGIIDHKLIWRQYPKFQQQQKITYRSTWKSAVWTNSRTWDKLYVCTALKLSCFRKDRWPLCPPFSLTWLSSLSTLNSIIMSLSISVW